jgi:hypothetical protein
METGKIEKSIEGEKLYQKRARKALSLLIEQAIKEQKPILYSDLARKLEMTNPRNLNYVLGSVGATLQELSVEWKDEIPPITCLAINKSTGLPSGGIDEFLHDKKFSKCSRDEQQKIIDDEQRKIYAYPRWHDVLKHLGLEDNKTQEVITSNRCWWFGINNISKRSAAAKNHVIYSELIPLIDGSQREFEWRYHNKAKRFYEQMQPDDKIVFWMGDGDNPNWGVFGFGKISKILYNSIPALRRYFLSIDFIPSSSIAPYPSKHPQETETTKFLLNLFGLNFRPLGKTFRNLGYDTTRTIITIDEVSNEKYNSLLEYAEAYFPSSEPLEFAEKVEKDIANGKVVDSVDVERELQKLNPDILRVKAQSAKQKPERQATQSLAFVRSPFVSAYAKQRANGICQLCDNPAPFVSRKGEPYLETHHIIWLSNGGDDTIENTVALCPNCHRKMHKLDLADDKKYLEQKANSLAQ